jgi:hypothetical protein
MRRALVAAVVLALGGPALAEAAVVDLGSGTTPGIAMDAAGTAYIAWIGVESNTTTLHFCRLPRDAAACDLNTVVAAPGTSGSRPYVLVQGTTVHVFHYRYGLTSPSDRFDAIYRFTSTNGGATFDAGTQVGILPFEAAAPGQLNTLGVIANNSGRFQSFAIDATSRTDAFADLNPNHPYNPALAFHGGRLLALSAAGDGLAQFRVHASDGVDPNTVDAWSAPADLGYVGYGRFAYGSRTFLLYDGADGYQAVREYLGGDGWAAPVVLPGPTKELSGGTHDIVLDGAARLHAVWPLNDATGFHVGYATSDDGQAWKVGRFDVADPSDLAKHVESIRVAMNADHLGVAAFDNGGGSGAIVRAVALGPEPPVPPPAPTPTPTPAPTPSLGKTVTAQTVKGTVLVKAPGASGFVALTSLASVPVGSTLDTRKGTVRLSSAAGGGAVQTGDFYDGLFVVKQKAASKPVTDLVLTGGKFGSCPKAKRATAAATAKTVRRLWGNGKGRFRTVGKHSAATVRGTVWLVEDRCDGTLTRVKSGSVSVRDLRRRRTVVVKAPRSYLARARAR